MRILLVVAVLVGRFRDLAFTYSIFVSAWMRLIVPIALSRLLGFICSVVCGVFVGLHRVF